MVVTQPCSHQQTDSQMVGLDRIELSTSRLSGVRSNHLSYRPNLIVWDLRYLKPRKYELHVLKRRPLPCYLLNQEQCSLERR